MGSRVEGGLESVSPEAGRSVAASSFREAKGNEGFNQNNASGVER